MQRDASVTAMARRSVSTGENQVRAVPVNATWQYAKVRPGREKLDIYPVCAVLSLVVGATALPQARVGTALRQGVSPITGLILLVGARM